MTRFRSLRNSGLLIGGQGVAQLASAITFVILARSLGVQAFGGLSALYGAAMFLGICVEFGSTNHLVRELNRGGAKYFPGQYRSRLLLTGFMVCISVALSAAVPSLMEYAMCVGFAFVLAHSRYLSAPLRANLQIGTVAFLAAIEKLLTLSVVVIFSIWGQLDTAGFFVISLVVSVVSCVFYRLYWSRRYVAMLRSRKAKRFCSPYAGTRNMGLSSVAIGLQSLDSVVIVSTAGPTAAGVYAAVGRWTQPLSLVTQAVTQSAFAEMTQGRRHSDALASLRKHLGMLIVAAVPLVVVFVFADALTLAMLGPDYASSTPVLRILICAVLFGIINSPLSAFLQARSDEAFTSRILLVAMPTQLTLMGVLAFFGGAALGAIAVVGIQGALALALGLRVRHLNNLASMPLRDNVNGSVLKPSWRHFSRK